jgi:MoxR-like ATPase
VNPKGVQAFGHRVLDEIEKIIVGKREVLGQVLLSILANGHILFEDYPGLAKTLIARSFSATLGCSFRRVQFTPDLLPNDITGTYILNRTTSQFELRKGPIFTNILLGDEINRAPPKTQSALLEAMQERQTTIEGDSYPLPDPFIVIATQNPIEYEGTYPLPEAQLDRFLVKLGVGYPSPEAEIEMMARRIQRKRDEGTLAAIGSAQLLQDAQRAVEEVYMDASLLRYIEDIVGRTRAHPHVDIGASPRGCLALLKLGRAGAAFAGRDYAVPDDIKAFAVPALSHRLILKPDPWVKGVQPSSVINEIVQKVPVPKVPSG